MTQFEFHWQGTQYFKANCKNLCQFLPISECYLYHHEHLNEPKTNLSHVNKRKHNHTIYFRL